MFKKNIILLFCVTFIAISCDNTNNNKKSVYSLSEISEKSFALDTLSPFLSYSCQLYNDSLNSNKRYFSFVNKHNNTIYLYDYDSVNNIKKINFPLQGPDAIPDITDHKIQNWDTIFAYSHTYRTMFLTNVNKEILNKYKLIESFDGIECDPYLTTRLPLQKLDNELFIDGVTLLQTTKKLKMILNLKDGSIKYAMNYPLYYQGKNMHIFYGFYSELYNPLINKFVYSFAGFDSIYVTDLKTKTKAYYCGSKGFDKIKLTRERNNIPVKQRKLFEATNPEYNAIIWDNYRGVYYRFVLHGINKDKFVPGNPENRVKALSIIIMNKDFNILGETFFKRFKYYEKMFFVTKEGLHVLKYKKSLDNEEFMVFGILKLSKNE